MSQTRVSARPIVAISQRVVVDGRTGERRDALDQQWAALANTLDCVLWPIPNNPVHAKALLHQRQPQAVILSGGNDVGVGIGCDPSVGECPPRTLRGDAPERDETETVILRWSAAAGVPVVG